MHNEHLAKTLLEVAMEVERDELRIKRVILDAARRGDVGEVERIILRWLELPVGRVLSAPVEPTDHTTRISEN